MKTIYPDQVELVVKLDRRVAEEFIQFSKGFPNQEDVELVTQLENGLLPLIYVKENCVVCKSNALCSPIRYKTLTGTEIKYTCMYCEHEVVNKLKE